MKNKKGFTLIEILLVVGSMAIIMIAITGIMFGIFASKNKSQAMSKITQSGNWILDELKKTILNANGGTENGISFSCPVGTYGNSITITNVKDGDKTTVSCFDSGDEGYKIASVSGQSVGTTVYLFQKNNDLFLKDCLTFVTCSTLPSLQLSEVKFNFNLGAGEMDTTSETNKDFSIDVTLRN